MSEKKRDRVRERQRRRTEREEAREKERKRERKRQRRRATMTGKKNRRRIERDSSNSEHPCHQFQCPPQIKFE